MSGVILFSVRKNDIILFILLFTFISIDKMELINSDITLDELFEWVQAEIEKGNFPQFKDKSDKELLELVKVAKPLIEIELKLANTVAWEQVNSIKKKKEI